MSTWTSSLPPSWEAVRPNAIFRERREASTGDDEHLTPSQHHGVLTQANYMSRTGTKVVLNLTAPDNMKHVEPDDFIAHLRSFQGGIEKSDLRGKVSTAYTVIQPLPAAEPRFFKWVLKSPAFISELAASCEQLRDGQSVKFNDFARIRLPLPPNGDQRRIADFLDDRVAGIDRIIAARHRQVAIVEEAAIRASYDAVRGEGADRRDSGLTWLGSVPRDWPVLTVNTEFQVDLGKMLDEKRQTGATTIPYLRNTNVQWDRINTGELKSMDVPLQERSRFTVRRGDLLICEGGQPGRAAIYTGDIEPLGFQKALHRARSRGRSRPQWLLECLRTAVHLNVFDVANGQTTIGHLTNEQLRSTRFPFPPPDEQDAALAKLHERWSVTNALTSASRDSISRLKEYKQSLVTAAVTGELDVTTAGSGIPG